MVTELRAFKDFDIFVPFLLCDPQGQFWKKNDRSVQGLILLFIFPLVALLLTYLILGFRNIHYLGKYPCVRKIMELFATFFVRQRMEISACSFTITVLV